jgi:murein DD-endopeptidase MepM/ murein hydrolase activator NlpD
MTPVRLAALSVSLVVLLAAVWLVFMSPGVNEPAASPVAQLPSAPAEQSPDTAPATAGAATHAPSLAPGATAPPVTPLPGASPNPLAKELPPRSVEPEELTGYEWPVRDARITGRFAPRPTSLGGFVVIEGEPYHDGLDLATDCGDRVRAAHDGTVLYAGRNFDVFLGYQGNAEAIYARYERQGRVDSLPIVVVIDDGNGYRSVYVHLNRADVEAGEFVQAGDVIGVEGATGFATGCHLHYGLIRMDGGWQEVVGRLQPFGYPPLARERINPLVVLPWDDEFAPQVLKDRVDPPSHEPSAPATSPGTSTTPTA